MTERPDTLFPSAIFAGEWILRRQVVSVDIPLGEKVARTKAGYFFDSANVKDSVEFPVAFHDRGDGTAVLKHREAWEAWSKSAPETEPMRGATLVSEMNNGTTITISLRRRHGSTGSQLQTRNVRRNYNLINKNTFDVVEYAFDSFDGINDDHFYLAHKIMTRWRAIGPNQIEGTELNYFFQSASTFDEYMNWPLPNYPTPVLATKVNICLFR